ncbi:MAG: hypothetical protein Q9162_007329 [Coniocarpon cinnabarinum]
MNHYSTQAGTSALGHGPEARSITPNRVARFQDMTHAATSSHDRDGSGSDHESLFTLSALAQERDTMRARALAHQVPGADTPFAAAWEHTVMQLADERFLRQLETEDRPQMRVSLVQSRQALDAASQQYRLLEEKILRCAQQGRQHDAERRHLRARVGQLQAQLQNACQGHPTTTSHEGLNSKQVSG